MSTARRSKSDRRLDAVEACLWLALLVFGCFVALEFMRGSPEGARAPRGAPTATPGLVEAESLRVADRSREFTFWLQPTSSFGSGRWSRDGQMFAFETKRGDWIELELPALEPGAHRLEVFLTRARDYGIVALSLNGSALGEVDLWSQGVVATGAIDLGEVDLRAGANLLRIEVTGANPRAEAGGYQFGIDGIRLTRP